MASSDFPAPLIRRAIAHSLATCRGTLKSNLDEALEGVGATRLGFSLSRWPRPVYTIELTRAERIERLDADLSNAEFHATRVRCRRLERDLVRLNFAAEVAGEGSITLSTDDMNLFDKGSREIILGKAPDQSTTGIASS